MNINNINDNIEFNNMIDDILKNNKFMNMKYERHHGISRMEHSLNVARITFKLCKFFRVKNLAQITRAGLLHDFYLNNDVNGKALFNHPAVAAQNAKNIFNVNDLQYNIIYSHMFPFSKNMPKHMECLIVGLADKIAAVKECTRYKFPSLIGASLIFILNVFIIQR